MADAKISALDNLTAADAINDMIPIVDVSDTPPASGNTKRISINNLLSSSPTASGALTVTGLVTAGSATITGALTIGGATSFPASVINTSGGNPVFTPTAATLFLYSGSSFLSIRNQANTQEIFNLTPAGVYTFGDGAGGTRMTLNSTGLGIGVSPTQKLHVKLDQNAYTFSRIDNQNVSSGAYAALMLAASGNTWGIGIGSTAANSNALDFFLDAGGANSVKMTLDTSGNLLVGRTTALGGKIGIQAEGGNGTAYLLRHNGATAGKYRIFAVDSSNNGLFYDQNNVGMYMADAGTSWVATSDETQKDIIEPIINAVAKVGSLRSVIGKFKTDSEGTRRSFLIAQDVQAVLPEAINKKDGLLGLSYTDVIPLLVAAIKELTARVQTLEAR